MSDFYMKIARVLELELSKDCTNTAVAGGFENFQNFIDKMNHEGVISVDEHKNISSFFKTYGSLDLNNRRQSLKIVQSAIESGKINPFQYFKTPSKKENNIVGSEKKTKTHQDPALYAGLQSINGIGPRNAKYFEKLDIYTIYDLLRFFPRKYQDFSQLKTINQVFYGEEVTLTGLILGDVANRKPKGRKLTISEAILSDSTGTIKLIWFNQPFLKNQLKAGMAVVVSGKVDQFRGRLLMKSPAWEVLEGEQIHTNRIVPIYHGTAGISQKQIRKIIKNNIATIRKF